MLPLELLEQSTPIFICRSTPALGHLIDFRRVFCQRVEASLCSGQPSLDSGAWIGPAFARRNVREETDHRAAQALEVLEAERTLLLKEQKVARAAIEQWEQRRRKDKGSLPTEEERAKNPEYGKLMRLIAECDKGLKRIERRRRGARDRESHWPGTHWGRSTAVQTGGATSGDESY